MILIFEISNPFQLKPGWFKSDIMFRVWWLWFAIAYAPMGLQEFEAIPTKWVNKPGKYN